MAYEFASRLETFPNYRKFETTFAGRPFVVETGKCAVCPTAAHDPLRRDLRALQRHDERQAPRRVDFFPLSVEFEEKLYAAGRIPGSFMRVRAAPASTPSCPPALWTAPSARCSPRICATMSA